MYYYIPGCDVRRNHPAAISKLEKYMNSKGIHTAECCRKDLSFLREEDVIIENCTLCELMLAERTDTESFISLYEYLLKDDFAWPDYQGITLTLQDCFRTRNNASIQEAVRRCLKLMNINVIETAENRSETEFCGVWLNNPPAHDCVQLAPKTFDELDHYRHLLTSGEQKEKMEKWVRQYETEKVAVYCNGCERGIRLGGGNPVHMVELIARDLQ